MQNEPEKLKQFYVRKSDPQSLKIDAQVKKIEEMMKHQRNIIVDQKVNKRNGGFDPNILDEDE